MTPDPERPGPEQVPGEGELHDEGAGPDPDAADDDATGGEG